MERLDIIQINPLGNLEEEIDAMWQDDGLDLFEAQIPPVNIIDDVIHAEDLWGHEELNADELDNLDIIQMEKMKEDDIICEYAKSNRSTCKICGKGIEKKALRVGKNSHQTDGTFSKLIQRWNYKKYKREIKC